MTPIQKSKRAAMTILVVLTCVNLLNYIDRYIFSALLEPIKRDLGFSDTQLGLLGSAFIFSYLLISPVFGYFGDRANRPRIMAFGAALWSLATALTGVVSSFTTQMLARVTVGVGESAYAVIAPGTIADHFPKEARGRVFAVYSGALTVGSALGFMLGGWLEPIVGWRHAFFIVGGPGLVLAAVLFFLRDPRRGGTVEHRDAEITEHDTSGAITSLSQKQVYSKLLRNGGLFATILGYAAYTFVVGGMSFWMPSYIVRYFDISLTKGNLIFGGLTVIGGFIGTLIGGWWADRTEKHSGNGYLKVAVCSMVLASPLFYLAVTRNDFTQFAVALLVMEIALFLCISPLDVAVVSFVRPEFRATAMALNIFLIHFLGDGISRTMMGAISDASDLRTAVAFLVWVLGLAGLIWLWGLVRYWQPMAWPKGALTLPKLQAHRGFRPEAHVIENTLEAFRLAKKAGAEMIELDVQLTKDGEAVVFHDEDLRRLAKSPERLLDLTAAEIKSRVNAPLLKEVLRDADVPSRLNIELKWAKVRGGGLEEAVVRDVTASHAEGRVLFSSFNPFVLRRLAKLAPNVPRALVVTEEDDPRNHYLLKRKWLGFLARPHLLHLDHAMITEKRLVNWQDRRIPVVAWTVNDSGRARELLALGVESVISDAFINEGAVSEPDQAPKRA
jgi:glycerophosphoryl diester phosphodiesterase/sugar phosphate permease